MTTDSAPWLVVGLGNPGPRYAGNRHNVGAMVVEELATRTSSPLKAHKARAAAAQARIGALPGTPVVLAVPGSVHERVRWTGVGAPQVLLGDPRPLVVVHDELDIDAGSVRLKKGGGEGGHNGLRSISASLGTRDYLRVRVGIGRPPGRMDPADFVLRDFSATERKDLPFLVGDAADAVEMLVAQGILAAQQHFHAPA